VGARLDFCILGPFEVSAGGRTLQLGPAKQRAMLALLVLNANEPVSTDRLIDDLWGGRAPAKAGHSLQVYVSRLRKELDRSDASGAEVIVSRPPGYMLRIAPEQLDVRRFEVLADEAARARAAGDLPAAAELLRSALALWRGDALTDLAYETFAQVAIARLEEMRLAALERRIEADLELGRHAELAGELEDLVAGHPLRERLQGLRILALYRSGRQVEALDAYHRAREVLVRDLGLEPSPALQELQRAILRHDPSLELAPAEPLRNASGYDGSILLLDLKGGACERLLVLAEPLARHPARELILAAIVDDSDTLESAAARLHERRTELRGLGVPARAAALTSAVPALDAVRLASEQEVDLLLVDGTAFLAGDDSLLAVILDRAVCDVGVMIGHRTGSPPAADGPVVVPFGGSDSDWTALELAARLAANKGVALRLLGLRGDQAIAQRDASRLLASASLAVQRVTGIPAEPRLVDGGLDSLRAAAADAFALVAGLSPRWREQGIGAMRLELARDTKVPVVFVRESLRPGSLAPRESLTHYTWSLAARA
jgi:DNA-binding SARP family transcriptional activator